MFAIPPPGELLAILSGWLAAAFGWIKWLHELREKRREKAAKDKAESELVAIRRQAADSRPLFLLSQLAFNGVTVPSGKPAEHTFIPPGNGCLLCYVRDEVDRKVPAGDFIFLLVENHGSNAYEITIQIDGHPARL